MIGKLMVFVILFLLIFGAGMYFEDKYCIGCMDWNEWIQEDNCVIWGKPCSDALYLSDNSNLKIGGFKDG